MKNIVLFLLCVLFSIFVAWPFLTMLIGLVVAIISLIIALTVLAVIICIPYYWIVFFWEQFFVERDF